MTSCPECNGSKHVYREGRGYIRCACVVRHLARGLLRVAGVPEAVIDMPADALLAGSRFAREGWVSDPFAKPMMVWVRGGVSSRQRLFSWCWALRVAVDAGLGARAGRVSEIVDAKFDRDQAQRWRADLASMRCVVVDLDAGRHAMLPGVMLEVWSVRSTAVGLTLFHSSDDVSKMPGLYGPEVAGQFARSRGLRRYGP